MSDSIWGNGGLTELWKGMAEYTEYSKIPVLRGPLLGGHPLLSGHLPKSRKSFLLITVKLTCIKRSPVLSGRGHLFRGPNELFLIVFTSIKRSL